DEIGGRVPGTPAMDRAVAWGVDAFKTAGADNVSTEEFSIPASWEEGNTQVEINWQPNEKQASTAVRFRARAVSIAWAPPLSAQHIPVVDLGFGRAEDFTKAGDVSGKILLVHSKVLKTWEDLFDEYVQAAGVVERASKAKARAIAFLATREHDILYR